MGQKTAKLLKSLEKEKPEEYELYKGLCFPTIFETGLFVYKGLDKREALKLYEMCWEYMMKKVDDPNQYEADKEDIIDSWRRFFDKNRNQYVDFDEFSSGIQFLISNSDRTEDQFVLSKDLYKPIDEAISNFTEKLVGLTPHLVTLYAQTSHSYNSMREDSPFHRLVIFTADNFGDEKKKNLAYDEIEKLVWSTQENDWLWCLDAVRKKHNLEFFEHLWLKSFPRNIPDDTEDDMPKDVPKDPFLALERCYYSAALTSDTKFMEKAYDLWNKAIAKSPETSKTWKFNIIGQGKALIPQLALFSKVKSTEFLVEQWRQSFPSPLPSPFKGHQSGDKTNSGKSHKTLANTQQVPKPKPKVEKKNKSNSASKLVDKKLQRAKHILEIENNDNGISYPLVCYAVEGSAPEEKILDYIQYILTQVRRAKNHYISTPNSSIKMSVLALAVKRNYLKIVDFLISKGANINFMNKWERGKGSASGTALHIAVMENQPEMVQLLIDKGLALQKERLELEKKNEALETPMDLAEDDDIKKRLRKALKS